MVMNIFYECFMVECFKFAFKKKAKQKRISQNAKPLG